MEILRDAHAIRTWSRAQRAAGRTIGFVPTMGALHEGHRSLIDASAAENDATVVSIFVNPAQFAPHEDLDKYPRTWEADLAMCEAAGAEAIYAPDRDGMYPDGYSTYVEVHGLQDGLCGASRPIFFRGVATVVTKLFNVVEPDRAYFGQKDAQQAAVIVRMVRDLDFAIEIRVMPTVREADGLAMSSRNRYLDAEQRQRALCLSRALNRGIALMAAGERSAEVIKAALREEMAEADAFDYAEAVDAETLTPLETMRGKALLAVAAIVGPARLIDNATYEVSA